MAIMPEAETMRFSVQPSHRKSRQSHLWVLASDHTPLSPWFRRVPPACRIVIQCAVAFSNGTVPLADGCALVLQIGRCSPSSLHVQAASRVGSTALSDMARFWHEISAKRAVSL